MAEPEEVQQEEEGKKGLGGLLPIIISAVVSAVVAGAVAFFVVPMVLGQNKAEEQKKQQEQVQLAQPREITAVLISPGTNQTFVLKGARDVVVIDSLTFKVGSDECRAKIAERKPEILDALMKIFMSKEKSELSTVAGIELLKKQIKDAVNLITGFTGDKEKFGVLEVYLYIKAFASTE